MSLPKHVVVDTNVAATANALRGGAPIDCVAACARALMHTMDRGHVYIDDGGGRSEIVAELRRNASPTGEPGPGDKFLRWLLTHEWLDQRVTRVTITPRAGATQEFEELPTPTDGTVYDPSDRKFLAVAAAHPRHPRLLQALDSKWWGWQAPLSVLGVKILFLCPEAIREKFAEKMGKS